MVAELSSMLLHANKRLNITRHQKDLIKDLFGDVATKNLKDRITDLENKNEVRTRELIELKEEFKTFMCSYLDDIQRFETPRVLISTVENKLTSNRVRYNPKILQECLTESTSEGNYLQIKIDILNRLQDLNEEVSSKEAFESQKMIQDPEQSKGIDHDTDTFMMELEYLENMSLKNPNKTRTKESKQDVTEENLLSKVSISINNPYLAIFLAGK